MKKNSRQEAILQIIESTDVETQEELLNLLGERGFDATQATISRDIRQLKLVKSMTSKGKYHYEYSVQRNAALPKFNSALTESVIKLDIAENILIIHTYPGMAPAVAACVDSMKLREILGCVAGDDTIIAVTSSKDSANEIFTKLQTMVHTV